MLQPGDRVGVAVSGGADSVALLLLLLELRAKLGVVLSVIHFNHKLRGKASDADEKFVARLAAKHGLEFHAASIEVAKKAKKERANLEDAARRARYDYFRSLAESGVCQRIAVDGLLQPWKDAGFNTGHTEFAGKRKALSTRMVRRIVEKVKPRAGQLGARHVEAVLELARNGRSGSSISLPGGVEVRKERD